MRAGTIFRGALLLAIVMILAWLVAAAKVRAPPADPPAAPQAIAARPSPEPAGQLLVPVAGVRRAALTDTFSQARGRGRPHDAIDIMAPRGTPVVAAADGIVEKLFFSNGGGGITVYVRSPDRQWIHYYAHLDAYAPGLREGARVRRGDPIGTVGSTGNANPAGPHLHFAIHFMAPGERWWQGRPINPYPLLAAPGPRR
jgi:murein DD-endopeptidase MepM/ murein hydrolase activator NlpD